MKVIGELNTSLVYSSLIFFSPGVGFFAVIKSMHLCETRVDFWKACEIFPAPVYLDLQDISRSDPLSLGEEQQVFSAGGYF